MNTILEKIFIVLLAMSLFSGCASHSTPQNTSALYFNIINSTNTDNYNTITVLPFIVEKDVKVTDPKFVENFSAQIYSRLRFDHPGIFKEVRWNKSNKKPGEAIVTGLIRKYEPGSALKRDLLIGLGAASFKGEMVIKDSLDGKTLLSAPFDEQAWGGGYSRRSFQNLVTDTAIAISKTISLWKQGQITR